MTDVAMSPNRFDFGQVIGRTFGSIGHNAATFAALALLLVGAPALISTIGLMGVLSQLGGLLAPTPGTAPVIPHLSGPASSLAFIGGLIGFVTNAMFQGAVIYGTAAYLNGREASFGECLGAGVRRCLPLIGLSIAGVIGIGFGLLLFLVPGIMMAVAWIVAAPVLVIERTGVFGAFGRSADLTRGRRWPIFGLVFLYSIAQSAVQQVLNSLMSVAFGAATPLARILNPLPAGAVLGVAASVVVSAGIASIYYELRSTREGIGPEALAAVFD